MRGAGLCVLCICMGFFARASGNDSLKKTSPYTNQKGKFYFYWGYNRSFFSKTNLHMRGPNYDFTLYDVKGKDSPLPFSYKSYVRPTSISIPQFNVRMGFNLTNKWSISAGYDHMKYVMTRGQQARMSGYISPGASKTYAGQYLDSMMTISPDLLTFEHTDGFNVVTVDVEYQEHLLFFCKGKSSLQWNIGVGGFFLVPRSDVRVFNYGLNNKFHVAGYTMNVKTGLRFNFFKNFFLQSEIRTGYATLPDVLVHNDSPERIDHNISYFSVNVVAGVHFGPFKRKETKTEQ